MGISHYFWLYLYLFGLRSLVYSTTKQLLVLDAAVIHLSVSAILLHVLYFMKTTLLFSLILVLLLLFVLYNQFSQRSLDKVTVLIANVPGISPDYTSFLKKEVMPD